MRELLIFNRQLRALELYRQCDGGLLKVGDSTLERREKLASQTLPLTFCLTPGMQRPRVEVGHTSTGERWTV